MRRFLKEHFFENDDFLKTMTAIIINMIVISLSPEEIL